MTPQEQQAYYKKNAEKGKAFEKAQDEKLLKPVREAGEAAVKGMSEGKMNPMGDTYRKGGKVMEHKHNVDHVKHHYDGAGHEHEQEKVKKHYHEHPHKMHHEHVKSMCGGGYMGKRAKD